MADTATTNVKEAAPVDADQARVPTVVVDDVHIVYKVHGAGSGKGSATSALSRIISRKRSPAIDDRLPQSTLRPLAPASASTI